MARIIRLLTFNILLLLTIPVSSIASGLHQLSLTDGICGSSVMGFLEDTHGVMWIATSNGINLYDGYYMQSYSLPTEGKQSPVLVYQLCKGEKGSIYAATDKGIYVLYSNNNEFHRIFKDVKFAECVTFANGNLFIGNRQGLFMSDDDKHLNQIYGKQTNKNNSVRDIKVDRHGDVWFTTRMSLNKFSVLTGKMTSVQIPTETGLNRFDFFKNRVVVGSKADGLFIVDKSLRGSAKKILEGLNVIHSVHTDKQQKYIYIATDGTGAYVIDGTTYQIVEKYGILEDDSHRISTNAVLDFYPCSNGTRWFGTFRYGLFHSVQNNTLFDTYRVGTFDSAGKNVLSFLLGKETILAVNGGFYVVNNETGASSYYDTSVYGVYVIKKISEIGNKVYLSSIDHGMLEYNKATHSLSRLSAFKGMDNMIVANCAKDKKNHLWIITTSGIYMLNDNDVTMYNNLNSNILSGPSSIVFDKNGNGWISTMYGLSIYQQADSSVKNSDFPKGFVDFTKCHLTTNGKEIFGYRGNTIVYSDASMTNFGELALPKGVLDEVCTDVMVDRQNRIWLVSEKGLFMYDRRTKSIQHYNGGQALTFQGINTRTLQQDASGNIWIGTTDGLKYMKASRLKEFSHQKRHIHLDNLRLGNELVSKSEYLNCIRNGELNVKWNIVSSNIEFNPYAVHYSTDNNQLYEYRVDDGQWTLATTNKIVVKSLFPGKHILELRESGTVNATRYTVWVSPSWLFWLEVALLTMSVVIFVWWKRYVRNTNIIIQEHKETEQALIDEHQSMAHEETNTKYAKSRQSDEELASVSQKMEEYVKTQKPYLNQEFKLGDMAAELKISPSKLSQVFSLYLNVSYYDYINSFRLEEFKQLVAQGLHKKLTVTALSEQCGFKKTSFFSTFRKLEGMTPTEYIKKH